MDPLGFALENFDTVGQYRVRDPDTGDTVDSAGVLPDGTRSPALDDLRRALIAHPEQFVQTRDRAADEPRARPPLVDYRDMPVVRGIGATLRARTTDSPPSSARSSRPKRSVGRRAAQAPATKTAMASSAGDKP